MVSSHRQLKGDKDESGVLAMNASLASHADRITISTFNQDFLVYLTALRQTKALRSSSRELERMIGSNGSLPFHCVQCATVYRSERKTAREEHLLIKTQKYLVSRRASINCRSPYCGVLTWRGILPALPWSQNPILWCGRILRSDPLLLVYTYQLKKPTFQSWWHRWTVKMKAAKLMQRRACHIRRNPLRQLLMACWKIQWSHSQYFPSSVSMQLLFLR